MKIVLGLGFIAVVFLFLFIISGWILESLDVPGQIIKIENLELHTTKEGLPIYSAVVTVKSNFFNLEYSLYVEDLRSQEVGDRWLGR